MIGLDDIFDPIVSNNNLTNSNNNIQVTVEKSPTSGLYEENGVGEMSDTSSSSSSSDSESDGGRGGPNKTVISKHTNGHANGLQCSGSSATKLSMPAHILKEDLCLSESGSDSD